MKKILLLSVMAFVCLNSAFAQCQCIAFQNPSFAGGTEGDSLLPPGWVGCVQGYEYTFPYESDDTLHAYHFLEGGFVGLRYSNFSGAVTQGAISDSLLSPLCANVHDTFSIALSAIGMNCSDPSGAECQIYGGSTLCDTQELLYTVTNIPTALINNCQYSPLWTLFTIPVFPTRTYNYITIMVNSETPSSFPSFYLGVDAITVICNHTPTGIDAISSESISIYPNPATNMITVNSGDNAAYTFMVYDLTGRGIITKEMTGTGTLDVSQLSKGCYLVKVIQGDKSYCQKLIVQ